MNQKKLQLDQTATGPDCNWLQPDLWLQSYRIQRWTGCSSPRIQCCGNCHRTGLGQSQLAFGRYRSPLPNAPPTTITITPTPMATVTRTTVTGAVQPAQVLSPFSAQFRTHLSLCHFKFASIAPFPPSFPPSYTHSDHYFCTWMDTASPLTNGS